MEVNTLLQLLLRHHPRQLLPGCCELFRGNNGLSSACPRCSVREIRLSVATDSRNRAPTSSYLQFPRTRTDALL